MSEARLLSAVLTSLSHLTTTRLTYVLPISSSLDIISRPATNTPTTTTTSAVKCRDRPPGGAAAAAAVSMVDDNHSASSVLGGEAGQFPMLVGHMLHQTEMELVGKAHSWTFRDVLDRLLVIAGNPVCHALGQVSHVVFDRLLVITGNPVRHALGHVSSFVKLTK